MLPQPSKSLIYLLLTFALFLGAVSVEVNIRETAIFPYNGTCNGQLLWTFNTENENLDVLKCVQNNCTAGDNFKNRVSLKPGALSLFLFPVLYNDEGLYTVMCDSVFLWRVQLKVHVPTTVSTSVGSNVTLHCYARTEKQITDDAVNILWKKEDQTVLQVQKGNTTYGSGFKGRASVSVLHYKDGDLSLTILGVTPLDKGLYRCYHRDTEQGFPGAVNLSVTADQKNYAKQFGDDLHLDLFGSDPVTVTFTGDDAAETLVCSVTENNPTCSSHYSHRVAVINGFLVVRGATSSDTGTFTVRDKMDEVLALNTVTVQAVPQRHYYITTTMFLLIGFTVIFLTVWYWCRGQSQTQQNRCHYNAVLSDVDINPEALREPACIGFSQQETNPEPEVRPRTPVEETMPETVRTTEKQDDTEEYITTGTGLEETI